MRKNINLEVGGDGVALLTLDVQGRSMNVYTPDFTRELQDAIGEIERRDDIAGVVITSAKSSGFMAGADILDFVNVYDSDPTASAAAALVAPSASALRALERCGKPVAVAINGIALGGGLELCLACHFRVLADAPKALIGLPEVTLGLLPAGGGTQRLPRLIGIQKALPILLTGRSVGGTEALELGIVDAVVPNELLVATARAWVLENPSFKQPWDREGFVVPGGVGALASHAMDSFSFGLAKIRRETQDNFPAPVAILSAVYEGTLLPIDEALQVEQAYFGQLLAGPVARNLMRTMFVGKVAAKKLARRPQGVDQLPIRRLGILGAGMMGAGIANVAATSGIDVVLVDTSQAAAEAGKARIEAAYLRDVKAGRKQQDSLQKDLGRIVATSHYEELRGCDFLVEAVFEDREVKAKAYRHALEGLGALPQGFVMASNTSTLPVTGLATQWSRPAEFLGLHFFSPVERMELVEVIRGENTSEHALARALDLVAQLGKLPIVVNDSPGFYTSRIFCSYVDEGLAMLAEGVAPALIENAAKQAGFATSPLAVLDEVSLDLQMRVIRQAEMDQLPTKFLRGHAKPVIEAMLARGRLGRKSGGGFYEFAPGQPKRLWPGISDVFPTARSQPSVEYVKSRLLRIKALESARCVEEGVVAEPADADLGSILALGFPSWTGGTLSFIETVGPSVFVRSCDQLADAHGERFRPSAWLRERARHRNAFYGE